MRTGHRLQQTDPRRRTVWCRTCGPTAVERDHLVGRWRCANEGRETRRERRARRQQETLDLALALARSPRPPF